MTISLPIPFLLRFLVACMALMLSFNGTSQVAPTWMSRPDHMWWRSELSFPNTIAPKLGVHGDFDGDGDDDLLASDLVQTHVVWNKPNGMHTWEALDVGPGDVLHLFWDERDELLWMQRSNPSRVEARRWNGTGWGLQASFEGSPQALALSPGLGLVALKRKGLELELLLSSGNVELLVTNASTLTQAYCWQDDKSEDKILLVQEKASGRLGMTRASSEGWEEVEWWEETRLTFQWQSEVDMSAEGQPVINILGADHQSLWIRRIDAMTGRLISQARAPESVGEVRFHQPRFKSSGHVEVVTHNPMTYAVRVCELNATTGELVDLTALEEMDKLPFVFNADLNGDGQREWMYPIAGTPTWSIVTPWSDLSMRWAWRNPLSPDPQHWREMGTLGQGWMDGLNELNDLGEVWMHRGKLHAKDERTWWVLEANPRETYPAPTAEAIRSAPHSHQLVLPYLELGDCGTGNFVPGIAEIQPHVWHHVAFSRQEDNSTDVWVDGELVFQGKSKNLNYFYNSILLGGYFGSHWTNHGAVSVDDVVLSGSPWTQEEIDALIDPEQNLDPARYSDRWEFEDERFTSERRKREMLVQSEPRLESGMHGKCVTFDGQDDALRTFIATPQKGISFSFFFRLNNDRITGPNNIATLYGMFNTWFNITWQPAAFLATPEEGQTVITTPSSCTIERSDWPSNSSPFLMNESLMLLDSGNAIWMEGPLGWEPRKEAPRGMQTRLGDPWIDAAGALNVLDKARKHWRWHPNEGWTQEGTCAAESLLARGAEPTGGVNGVILASDSQWCWWGEPSMPGKSSELTEPALSALLASPAGEMFILNNGQSKRHDTVKGPEGNVTPPLTQHAHLPTPWWWIVGFVFAAALGVWKVLSKRTATGQDPSSIPQALRPHLDNWKRLNGKPLGAVELDNLLSESEFETEETRRGRRARFVRECNEFGQRGFGVDLVLREKDAHDRRRVVFVLHPKALEILEIPTEELNEA